MNGSAAVSKHPVALEKTPILVDFAAVQHGRTFPVSSKSELNWAGFTCLHAVKILNSGRVKNYYRCHAVGVVYYVPVIFVRKTALNC